MAKIETNKRVTVVPEGVTITPSEGYDALMKAVLAGEPNFKPENIADGFTIWGVTGTGKIKANSGSDWPDPNPDDPHYPTEGELDEEAEKDDPNVPKEDYMRLEDDQGNVTKGYLYTEPDSGLMVYGGAVLPDIDSVWTNKTGLPYVWISIGETEIKLHASSAKPFAVSDELVSRVNKPCSLHWWILDVETNEWVFEDKRDYTGTGTVIVSGADYMNYRNFDLLVDDGTTRLSASPAPTPYTGFQITWYDPATTNFKAVGWRRVSKHTTGENAGKITRDNFTRTESGGWNYLKNIRSCTRDKLYYTVKDVAHEVWPDVVLWNEQITVPSEGMGDGYAVSSGFLHEWLSYSSRVSVKLNDVVYVREVKQVEYDGATSGTKYTVYYAGNGSLISGNGWETEDTGEGFVVYRKVYTTASGVSVVFSSGLKVLSNGEYQIKVVRLE